MTEFALVDGCVLGLMPRASAAALLGPAVQATASRTPHAELYLVVPDPAAYQARALLSGATELSPLQLRSWGDQVAYCLDLDGHVVAFASAD
jgi:hypothetical protein